jgi:SAM-dependent methyltransferase
MKLETIKSLKCQSCGSNIKVKFLPEIKGTEIVGDIIYAIAACDCKEYPIVGGILVARDYPPAKMALDAIRKAKDIGSLNDAMVALIEQRFVRMVIGISLKLKRFFRWLPGISFWKLSTFIEDSRWATYVKYRFSAPSFISGMALIPAINGALPDGGLILDAGCGFGHLSFMLSRYFGARNIYCVDKEFINLYFGRNYLVGSDASFICLDANEKLPLDDGTFSAIVSMDSVHYIHNKKLFADELKRILKSNGAVFFIHLHNKYVKNISQGLAETPEGYAGLFAGFKIRFFAERSLAGGLFNGSGVDLGSERPFEEIKKSDSISMAATRNDSLLKKYGNLFELAPKYTENEIAMLNPLYRRSRGSFIRKFPSEFYEEEYYLIKDFFPGRIDPNLPMDELRKKLIIIPLPKNYKKEGEQLSIRLWR